MNRKAVATSKSVFRVIRKSDMAWVGTGFVFFLGEAPSHLVYVTCAHVVASALNSEDLAYCETAPEGEFFIDFPNSTVRETFPARVAPNDPRAWRRKEKVPNERSLLQDIALLSLVLTKLPDDVVPVEVNELSRSFQGELVVAMGGAAQNTRYEENYPILAEGVVQSEAAALLQFKASGGGRNAFIEKGFSGGPLWSSESGQVLGIVALADEGRGIAFAIPIRALVLIFSPQRILSAQNAPSDFVRVEFPYKREAPELLLKRPLVEASVDETIDKYFLMYLYGEKSAGKTSEVHRLISHTRTQLRKDRTIWQTCINDTTFDEMADELSKQFFSGKESNSLSAIELIKALDQNDMFLVLDGYSEQKHPSMTRFLELSAELDPPTRLVVVSSEVGARQSFAKCAVQIPKVSAEEVIGSIEALGNEVTSELANLVIGNDFDASSAYRIVKKVRDGVNVEADTMSSSNRTIHLFENEWSMQERALMVCLALVESSIAIEFYLDLSKTLCVDDPLNFKVKLYDDSLVSDGVSGSFSLREFCKEEILERSSAKAKSDGHKLLGLAFHEKAQKKRYDGFGARTADLTLAFRAIRHLQLSETHEAERLALIYKVGAAAARKGMHSQLSDIVDFELGAGVDLDLWSLIGLIQSEVALGRIQRSFYIAKLTQSRLFLEEAPNLRLVVSLCSQFAMVLMQANQNALAGHLLNVSKQLFPQREIGKSLNAIRESLKAYCDGRLGKYDAAKKTGSQLLAAAAGRNGEGRFMQSAVEATRLGILEGRREEYREADRLLKIGIENFSKCDRRGEIWALSYRCFFSIKSSSIGIPRIDLERMLDLQSTSQLVSEETFLHFKTFEQALLGDRLHERVVSQSKEFEGRYEDRILSRYDIEYVEAFIEFLVLEFRNPKHNSCTTSQFENGFLSRKRLKEAAEQKISYVDALLVDEPVKTLNKLYEKLPTNTLIGSPFYSRLVTQLLLKVDDRQRVDSFINKYAEELKKAPRFVRLNYSDFFERCGRPDQAIELILTLKRMDSFRFHNIAANSYKTSDFEKSKYHNEQALLKANSPEVQARIHNNMAALFLLHGKADLMDATRAHLESAIRLRASHFYWPFRTQLAADLLEADITMYEEILENFSINQHLSERAVEYVSDLLHDSPKRMAFLKAAPKFKFL